MYDYSKLLGKMREQEMTQEELASYLNISSTSLSKKLKNRSQFKQDEMKKILDILNVPIDTVVSYFFTPILVKTQVNRRNSVQNNKST